MVELILAAYDLDRQDSKTEMDINSRCFCQRDCGLIRCG